MEASQSAAIAPADSRRRMRDGTELLLRTWLPDPQLWPEPSGTLLLVHGVAEHCGRYAHVAARLCALGLRVVAYDQRGHGSSGGARMVAERPDVFLDDLVEIYDGVVRRWPELPIVLGHSMGGLVAARLATSRVRPVRALVLSSPALALRLSGAMLTLQRMLLTLAPNLRVPSPIRPTDLSHDPVEVASYRSDPLVQRTLTAGMLQSMLVGIERAQADAPLLEAPTLLLVAGADRVVDPAGSRRFCDNAPADLHECIWFEHAYHEIFNEQAALRAEVLDALSDWLRRHLQPVTDAGR